MRTFLAIDGTNRVHVLWHVYKDASRVIKHLARDIRQLRQRCHPEAVALAFDVGRSFRSELAADYKAHRGPTDDRLKATLVEAQLLAIKSECAALTAPGFEADDVLATVAAYAADRGDRMILASPDKDLRQCLRPGLVTIMREWKSVDGVIVPQWLTAEALASAPDGVRAHRFVDFQCLVGDPSDGVRGAEGIGKKTAAKWLAKHSLDDLLANRWLVDMTERQFQSLRELQQRLPIVRQLVTLRTGVPNVCEWMEASHAYT